MSLPAALREAMRSLEHSGLIRMQKGVAGGAFVQDPGGEAVASGLLDMYHLGGMQPQHLTQARILYESVVVRLACARATQADIDALNQNVEAAEAARSSGNFNSRVAIRIEFHRMLARIAGNPIMVVVLTGVLEIMERFLKTIGPYDFAIITPSRRRFMAHFAKRDADAAVQEMETLLKQLEKYYLARVNEPSAELPM